MSELSPLQFIADNMSRLQAMCYSLNPNQTDELWDVVMDRVPRILERWDGERSLWRWLSYNLRWYMIKYLRARRTSEPLYDHTAVDHNRTDLFWVYDLLEGLDDYHRDLLVERYVLGHSRQELADYHGVSIETIKRDIRKAIQWVRKQHA